MKRKPKKSKPQPASLADIARIVREARLAAEAKKEELPEECLALKCKHPECKPPRTKKAFRFGQRRPKDPDRRFEDGVRRMEDGRD